MKKSTYYFLQQQIESFDINKKIKVQTKLHEPTINKYLNKWGREKIELFEKYM